MQLITVINIIKKGERIKVLVKRDFLKRKILSFGLALRVDR